jgi:hypothetical protein
MNINAILEQLAASRCKPAVGLSGLSGLSSVVEEKTRSVQMTDIANCVGNLASTTIEQPEIDDAPPTGLVTGLGGQFHSDVKPSGADTGYGPLDDPNKVPRCETSKASTNPTNPTIQSPPGSGPNTIRRGKGNVTRLAWLQQLGQAVVDCNHADVWIRTEKLADIAISGFDIDLPGSEGNRDLDNPVVWRDVLKSFGRRMSQCFHGANSIAVGNIVAERQTRTPPQTSAKRGPGIVHEYRFSQAATPDTTGNRGPNCTALPQRTANLDPSPTTGGKADAESLAAKLVERLPDLGLATMPFSRVRALAGEIMKGKHVDAFYVELGRALRTGKAAAKELAAQIDTLTRNANWIERTNWQEPIRRNDEQDPGYNNNQDAGGE